MLNINSTITFSAELRAWSAIYCCILIAPFFRQSIYLSAPKQKENVANSLSNISQLRKN